jgi:hypothetical protein
MEVVKGYESIPAYELVKYEVVRRLVAISESAAKVQSLIYLGRNDMMTIYQFQSEVLNFYQFLRPKINDYNENHSDEEYNKFTDRMDYYVMHPLKFNVMQAVIAYNFLNEFCERYKLTSTKMWTGQAYDKNKSLYNV